MRLKALAGLAFFAVLACSSVRADVYDSTYGPLYYPDGASITAVGPVYFGTQFTEQLSYSFADGTGVTDDPVVDGDVGSIDFTTPITAVTFDYTSDEPFDVTFDSVLGAAGDLTEEFPAGSGTETVDFTSNVDEIFWIENPASFGWGGITSLSYTEDSPVPTPEPPSILLAGIGLVALLAFRFFRRVPPPLES
jgi:hypothetical protein